MVERGFLYKNHSCYADSVLMCLFHTRNGINFISTLLENKHMARVYGRLQLKKTIGKFRKNIGFTENTNMEDATEFLIFLIDKLKLENILEHRETVASNENLMEIDFTSEYLIGNSNRKKVSSVITYSETTKVSPLKIVDIQDSNKGNGIIDTTVVSTISLDENNLYKIQGNLFSVITTTLTVIKANFLFFSINRLSLTNFNKRVVNFPSVLTTKQGDKLNLNSIIVFSHRHYSCYLRINITDWVYYNDMEKDIIPLDNFWDSFERLNIPNPLTHGILFFYFAS